jgi:SAM-dependent methyltransferase
VAARQLTRRFAAGIVTYVPGGWRLAERATGGTDSAAYCYEVWLRHLHFARDAGLDADPAVVAEIGPGDSLGAGIAALLTGASTYVAVDRVRYAATERDVAMVEEIRALLARRTPVRIVVGGVTIAPDIPPDAVLGEARLSAAVAPSRAEAIRRALRRPGATHDGVRLLYSAGADATLDLVEVADAVFSQAVLEHVDDLQSMYAGIHAALRPGGWMSHAIDFKSHAFAREWNGHWTFSDPLWGLIRGRRRYAINRAPLSTHLALIDSAAFEIVNVERATRESALSRSELAPRFRRLSEDDLSTASALVQAVKR